MGVKVRRVVILIPTYNEAENIGKLLDELLMRIRRFKAKEFRILVVDDNSPDGTGKIVRGYQKKHKEVVLLSGKKEGLGRAMVRGYKYAMEKLKAEAVVSNEADFAFDFKHLGYMLGKIDEGYDVVVGSRHVGVGKTEGWTVTRRLNHWMANKVFATWVGGVSEVYDHNGAFRAIRVKGVLDQLDWSEMPRGFGFFFYSLYKLTCVTDKFDEFAVIYRFRERGESKVSFNPKYLRTYLRDVGEYARMAFKIRMKKCKMKV